MRNSSILISLLLIITVNFIACSSKHNENNFVPVNEYLYSEGSDTTITMKSFKMMKGNPYKIVNSCGKEVTIRKTYLDSISKDYNFILQGKRVEKQLYEKADKSTPVIVKDDRDQNEGQNIVGGDSGNTNSFWDWLPWLILGLLLLIIPPLWVLAFNSRRRSSRSGQRNGNTGGAYSGNSNQIYQSGPGQANGEMNAGQTMHIIARGGTLRVVNNYNRPQATSGLGIMIETEGSTVATVENNNN